MRHTNYKNLKEWMGRYRMEFMKRKLGLWLLVISLVAIIAAIWYLLFGMSGNSAYEGGILVEGIRHAGKLVGI